MQKHHKKSSSSSDSSCKKDKIIDLLKKNSKIDCEILKTVQKLRLLECTPISKVPYVISKPGCYQVIAELTGGGITFATNDAILNLGGFTLTIPDGTTGININGFNNIIILNGQVTTPTISNNVNSVAISITNASIIKLDGVSTSNTLIGVNVIDVSNIAIVGGDFSHHRGISGVPPPVYDSPIALTNVNNALIYNNTFNDNISFDPVDPPNSDHGSSSYGLHTVGTTQNVRITNCRFTNTPILAEACQSLIYDNNINTITDPDYYFASIELGLYTFVINFQLTNSIFSNQNAQAEYVGVIFTGAYDGLVENVTISVNPTGDIFYPYSAAILVGPESPAPAPPFICNAITFRNVVIDHQPNYGIFVGPGNDGIVFENCTVRSAITEGIHIEPNTNCTVSNCKVISGTGLGISVVAGSTGIELVGNSVRGNAGDGIDMASNNCKVSGNSIYNNGGIGLNNIGTGNIISNNEAGNNSGGSYVGVGQVVTPGMPAAAGQNISY